MKIENESNSVKSLLSSLQESLFQHLDIYSILGWIDDWMCMANGIKELKKPYTTVEIISGYNMILMLYDQSHQLFREIKRIDADLQTATLDDLGACLEEQKYKDKPQYLSKAQILAPLQVLSFLETEEALYNYRNLFHQWLEFSLNSVPGQACLVHFEVYLQCKRLAEAVLLIVRRVLNTIPAISGFEDTCPLLLTVDERQDPYLELGNFFSCSSPGQYVYELKKWFRCALSENDQIDEVDRLLELHDQLIRIIQAGFIIKQTFLTDHQESCTNIRLSEKEVHQDCQYILSEYEFNHQATLLKTLLAADQIKEIRYGLREWLNCGISRLESIRNMEDQHAFGLYEKLEKIIWLLFNLHCLQTEINEV